MTVDFVWISKEGIEKPALVPESALQHYTGHGWNVVPVAGPSDVPVADELPDELPGETPVEPTPPSPARGRGSSTKE
jgi:hypothetical protein